jgi:hypothetical protein
MDGWVPEDLKRFLEMSHALPDKAGVFHSLRPSCGELVFVEITL